MWSTKNVNIKQYLIQGIILLLSINCNFLSSLSYQSEFVIVVLIAESRASL